MNVAQCKKIRQEKIEPRYAGALSDDWGGEKCP